MNEYCHKCGEETKEVRLILKDGVLPVYDTGFYCKPCDSTYIISQVISEILSYEYMQYKLKKITKDKNLLKTPKIRLDGHGMPDQSKDGESK